VPAIVSRLMSDITLRTTGDAAAPDHPPSVRRSFLLDPCVLLLPATVLLAAILLPFQPSRAFGLPAHPLLVHIPVVLVPLLGVAVVVLALRPAWRARYGPAAAVSAVVTMVGAILAAGAGEALRDQRTARMSGAAGVGPPRTAPPGGRGGGGVGGGGDGGLLVQHAALGSTLRLLVILLALALIVLVIIDRYGVRTAGRGGVLTGRPVTLALSGVVVVLAVLSVVWVVRTGHVGAQMTWGREGASPARGLPSKAP
jgi:hypothetical protein